MADDDNVLGFDADDFLGVISKIDKAWRDNAESVINWTKVVQLATDKATFFTATGFDQALNKITIKLKDTDEGLKLVSRSLDDGASRLTAYKNKIDEISDSWIRGAQAAQRATDLRVTNALKEREAITRTSQEIRALNDSDTEKRIMNSFREKEAIARQGQEIKALNARDASKQDDKEDTLFGLVARLNLANRALNFVIGSFKEGVSTAIDFERQMARIQLLRGGENVSSGSILSRAGQFGLSAGDTAAAAQGAIGVGQGSSDVLNAGAGLAQLSGSSAVAATSSLTAALNAFGLSSKDAGHAADVLAEGMQHGVSITDDFANSLGRIGLIAKPLGLRLEDVEASLEAFRARGVSAAQASSTLSNFLSRLSAPTAELTTKFNEVGAANAQQVIQMYGYSKALELVFNDTSDTSQVTEEFKNAIGGVNKSALAMSGIYKEIAGNVKDLTKNHGQLNSQLDKLNENAGESLHKNLQRIKTDFTEMGEDGVTAFDGLLKGAYAFRDFLQNNPVLFALLTNGLSNARSIGNDVKSQSNDEAKMKAAQRWAGNGEGLSSILQVQGQLSKSPEDIFKDREKAEIESYGMRMAKVFEYNKLQREQDKLTTENLKSELEIRIHRFEDNIKLQNEVATRARELGKQSVGRLETGEDSFETGRFNRQLSLLSPEQKERALNASIGNKFTGFDPLLQGLGIQNPFSSRLNSLRSGREALVNGVGDKNGQAFLDDKSVERELSKNKEISQILEEQFNLTANNFKNRKASLQDVLDVERQITDNKNTQDKLELKLQETLKEKEKQAKKNADAEQLSLDKVKNAARDAIALQYIDEKGVKKQSGADTLSKFDELSKTALQGAKGPLEALQLQALLDAKKKSLQTSINREEKTESFSTAFNSIKGASEGLANDGQTIRAIAAMTDFFKRLDNSIDEFLAGKLGVSSGTASKKVEGFGGSHSNFNANFSSGNSSELQRTVTSEGTILHIENMTVQLPPTTKPEDVQKMADEMARIARQNQRRGTYNPQQP